MFECRQLYSISHPFIDSMYIEKEFDINVGKKGKDILVIETKHNSRKVSKKNRQRQLLSFLADLDLIKTAVEKKAGKFDRIDIKYH